MLAAAKIDLPSALAGQPHLPGLFRIEPHHRGPVPGDQCRKGDIMLLGHFMVEGDEIFVIDLSDLNLVGFVRFLCFQWCQLSAAAGNLSAPCAPKNISAVFTADKFHPFHISRFHSFFL